MSFAAACGIEEEPELTESEAPVRGICTSASPSVVPPSAASAVIDGDINTHYGAGNNNWQSVTIDLGCTARITGVRRRMSIDSPGFASRVDQGESVSISADNITYTQLTGSTTYGWEIYDNYVAHAWDSVGYGWSRWLRPTTPIQARYVRYSWDGNFDKVSEVEVDSRTITASEPPTMGTSVNSVIDSLTTTGLTTAQGNWQHVQVDLGRSVLFARLRRHMTSANANRGFNGEYIQVSENATTWRTIQRSETAGWEGYTVHAPHAWRAMPYGWTAWLRILQPQPVRYVRFLWDANGTESFDELEIDLVSATTASSVYEPFNGAAFSGDIVGRSINFAGFATQPTANIRIQVLSDPALSVTAPSSWIDLGSVLSDATHTIVGNDSLFHWSASVVPVPGAGNLIRWPAGGVGRFRVLQDGAVVNTFDDFNCQDAHQDQRSPRDVSEICRSHTNGTIILIDGDIAGGVIPPSGTPYLSRRPTPPANAPNGYYARIGAETTLATWRTNRGFPFGETVARFYNAGDLGLGREMHCRRNSVTQQVSCYVTNYGNADDLLADQASALADLSAGTNPVATVAMDYQPNAATDKVRFYVYKHTGNTTTLEGSVALDREGAKNVPGICLACHAGRSNAGSLDDAQFLPFDVDSYAFSTTHPRAAQEEAFRQLNVFVSQTNPTPAITELINGWYHNTPTTANTPFDGSFVPNSWRPACNLTTPCKQGYICSSATGSGVCLDSTSLTPHSDPREVAMYRQVFAPYCRTCHIAQVPSPLPFDSYSAFSGALVTAAVCNSKAMPHAEVIREKLWRGPARAHIVGAFGPTHNCP